MARDIYKTLLERFGDPIGSYAGDAPVGVRSLEAEVCPRCGMMPIGGNCGCEADCGCGCGGGGGGCSCGSMHEALDAGPCPACGMLPIDGECNCSRGETCSGCGNSPQMCTCNVSIVGMYEGTEHCDECGMTQGCGCTHMEEELEEVTPPGHEKMVRGLKKAPGIDNPWAVAWAHHNKYGEPRR